MSSFDELLLRYIENDLNDIEQDELLKIIKADRSAGQVFFDTVYTSQLIQVNSGKDQALELKRTYQIIQRGIRSIEKQGSTQTRSQTKAHAKAQTKTPARVKTQPPVKISTQGPAQSGTKRHRKGSSSTVAPSTLPPQRPSASSERISSVSSRLNSKSSRRYKQRGKHSAFPQWAAIAAIVLLGVSIYFLRSPEPMPSEPALPAVVKTVVPQQPVNIPEPVARPIIPAPMISVPPEMPVLAQQPVLPVGRTAKWSRLQGARVERAQEIITTAGSACLPDDRVIASASGAMIELTLSDGSQITLRGETDARVEDIDDNFSLALQRGQLNASVSEQEAQHGFNIKTAFTRVSVVGTTYAVLAKPTHTDVQVSTGAVEVFGKDDVLLQRLTTDEALRIDADGRRFRGRPFLKLAQAYGSGSKHEITSGDSATIVISSAGSKDHLGGKNAWNGIAFLSTEALNVEAGSVVLEADIALRNQTETTIVDLSINKELPLADNNEGQSVLYQRLHILADEATVQSQFAVDKRTDNPLPGRYFKNDLASISIEINKKNFIATIDEQTIQRSDLFLPRIQQYYFGIRCAAKQNSRPITCTFSNVMLWVEDTQRR